MIFRNRPAAPPCLTEITRNKNKWGAVENQVAWGLQYEAKINNPNKSNKFTWAKYKNVEVNKLIIGDLMFMTQNHCSFCDGYPLKQMGATIEHFRPKSLFPQHSYLWINLFYCCNACQKKGERFDNRLLKPDVVGYNFFNFFICRNNGQAIFIEPNPRATQNEQQSAIITIELYGLNDSDRPEDRFRVWIQYNDSNNPVIDEFAYRFLFM